MTVHFFASTQLAASPWKNGGGTTQEIACWPPGAGLESFSWRISIARIARSGPFSAFPGIDRVITLLDGAGVRLHSADGRIDHALDEALQPFAFSGDVALDCDVLGDACHDFNVMTRRGVVNAQVTVQRGAAITVQAPQGLLLVRAGRWRLRGLPGHDECVLAAGADDGVYWTSGALPVLAEPLDGDAQLIAVELQEAAAA